MTAPKSQVLVVEDDADLRGSVAELLEDEGYRVRTAANGQEALEILEAGDRPCVILLDLMMPVMDGWQFLERKNRDRRFGECPVIVVSAYLDPPEPGSPAFAAPHLRVDGVLRKPIDLQQLIKIVGGRCA